MESVLVELLSKFKKQDLKMLLFEGTEPDYVYDMTVAVRNANLILVNSRVDLITTATPAPKSLALEIDGTVSSDFVIDNKPSSNYFRYSVRYNPQTIGTATMNISQYKPNTGYKMSGDINRQARFTIRDSSTGAVLPTSQLSYFFFQFQVV